MAGRWLELGLLAGVFVMPGGSALPATKLEKFRDGLGFRGRGWDWVDPLKDAQAAKLMREEGITTRSQIVASKGGDFEDNLIELAREEELIKQHGVKLGGAPPAKTQPGTSDNDTETDGGGDGPKQDKE